MNMGRKNTGVLALAIGAVAAISVVGVAIAADGSTTTPTAAPAMGNDGIPLCEDLPDFNFSPTGPTPTPPPPLPVTAPGGKPGNVLNVRCGVRPTVTEMAGRGPSAEGVLAPTIYRHLGAEEPDNGEVMKQTFPSGIRFLESGMLHTWEEYLDPVRRNAKELIFKITKLGDWEGPWEFSIRLE